MRADTIELKGNEVSGMLMPFSATTIVTPNVLMIEICKGNSFRGYWEGEGEGRFGICEWVGFQYA